jgi:hypothetical protein
MTPAENGIAPTTDRAEVERQLLLHLMMTPHRVFEVRDTESLSPLAQEFVERLAIGPTLAGYVGASCLIANTMSEASAGESEVVRYAAALEETSYDELRTLPPFHVVLARLELLGEPSRQRPAWLRHFERARGRVA